MGTDVPRLLSKRGTMDPLQILWELYEEVMEKPPLTDPEPPTVGTPVEDDGVHPISQQRQQVDAMRATGMDAEVAHENVFGEVDLGDVTGKSQLAATLSRVQNDGNRKGVRIQKDTDRQSLLAMDDEMEKKDLVSPEDLKTKLTQQTEDEPQVNNTEEFDYNFDVAYLQKYGRA